MNKKQITLFVGLIVLVFAVFFVINLVVRKPNEQKRTVQTTNNTSTTFVPTLRNTTTEPTTRSTSDISLTYAEKMIAPIERIKSYVVARKFYDESDAETQTDAIIVYSGTGYTSYISSMGNSYVAADESDFNVVSVFSGEVIDVKTNPLLNSIVTISHKNGVETIYHSLSDVKVAIGDLVEQGDVIGVSSESLLDSELGSHVYFEITKDGVYLNPEELIGTKLSDINKEE